MPRRRRILVCIAAVLSLGACEKKPHYDDVPIARNDRKKKAAEPPETFELEAICAQLVDLSGSAVDASQKVDLRTMCRDTLSSLQKARPQEYACRCHCIQAAGDLFAVERCTRYCSAEDVQRVCDHVVGVENDTNDAGVLGSAHDDCVKALNNLRDDDVARWSCTVRCLVAATAKDDALACSIKCGGLANGDAGNDAVPFPSSTTGTAPKPSPFPTEIE